MGLLMVKKVELTIKFAIQFVAVLILTANERCSIEYISLLYVQGKPRISMFEASSKFLKEKFSKKVQINLPPIPTPKKSRNNNINSTDSHPKGLEQPSLIHSLPAGQVSISKPRTLCETHAPPQYPHPGI